MKRPPSKLEKQISKNLKEMRGELSQVQFAKKLGIAQSTLNRIENCEQSVTIYALEKVCEKLKISIIDMLK